MEAAPTATPDVEARELVSKLQPAMTVPAVLFEVQLAPAGEKVPAATATRVARQSPLEQTEPAGSKQPGEHVVPQGGTLVGAVVPTMAPPAHTELPGQMMHVAAPPL